MMKEAAKTKKKFHISEKLKDGSSKALYSVVNQLMDNTKETVLPSADSDDQLAEKFLSFFQDKVEKIRSRFSANEQSHPNPEHPPKQLPDFRLTTEVELREITWHKVFSF